MSGGKSDKCSHGLNPRACLTCFHAPKPAAPPAPPMGVGGIPGIPVGRLPGQSQGAVVGDRTGAMIGEKVSGAPRVTPEERAKHRGERPPGPGSKGPPGATLPAALPAQEPFTYAAADGKEHDPNVLWEPPKRPEVIDRLPQHPEAGRMR